MTKTANNGTVVLKGNLLLNELSNKQFPETICYQNMSIIDLQQLTNIDSAGIAYLAQIKSNYPILSFVGITEKILVLAHLYGLSFIFNSQGVQ